VDASFADLSSWSKQAFSGNMMYVHVSHVALSSNPPRSFDHMVAPSVALALVEDVTLYLQ
jgi:hypothetical protein